MTELTFLDRVFVAYARYVERTTLWALGSQKLLRGVFSALAPIGYRPPKGCRSEKDPDGNIIVTPQGAENAPFLLYFHGGGFTIGSPNTNRAIAAHIAAEAGIRGFLAAYPLAPEHPFPAAPDAAFDTYRRLSEAGQTPVAIGGDSAGGNLALLTMQRARDAGLPLPKAAVLIAPVGDMGADLAARFAAAPSEVLIPAAWGRRVHAAYIRPGTDPDAPAVSPLNGDLTGLPPTLIHAAEGEALELDAQRLVDQMDEATLDLWPGLQHVWHLHAGVAPAATRACAALGAFIKARL